MFVGFKSQWMMPLLCKCCIAASRSRPKSCTDDSGKFISFWRRLFRSPPTQYSKMSQRWLFVSYLRKARRDVDNGQVTSVFSRMYAVTRPHSAQFSSFSVPAVKSKYVRVLQAVNRLDLKMQPDNPLHSATSWPQKVIYDKNYTMSAPLDERAFFVTAQRS